MNGFNWMLVGHLVGDWVLQSDWMADGKRKGVFTWPGMVHYALYTATVLAALWLSGVRDGHPAFYIATGAVIFCSHWLIDALSIAKHWLRLGLQSEREVVRLVVDQTLHLLVIVALLQVFSV